MLPCPLLLNQIRWCVGNRYEPKHMHGNDEALLCESSCLRGPIGSQLLCISLASKSNFVIYAGFSCSLDHFC